MYRVVLTVDGQEFAQGVRVDVDLTAPDAVLAVDAEEDEDEEEMEKEKEKETAKRRGGYDDD